MGAMFDLEFVKKRINTFGIKVEDEDELLLNFCIDKVEYTIRNETNQPEVPEGLRHIAADMVVGEFIMAKKAFAPDKLDWIDIGYAIKQIQTGDTNTVFATGEGSLTPEQRLNGFIDYLLSYGKGELSSYRRIKW